MRLLAYFAWSIVTLILLAILHNMLKGGSPGLVGVTMGVAFGLAFYVLGRIKVYFSHGENATRPRKEANDSQLESLRPSLGHPASTTTFTANDEALYGKIADELEGNKLNRALWTKCFAEGNGNENEAKARYIRIRVGQLKEQNLSTHPRVNSTLTSSSTTEPKKCPRCGLLSPSSALRCDCGYLWSPGR